MTTPNQKNTASAILLAGFIAGTLDATAACVDYIIERGKSPEIIFKYIASAVVGKEQAYSGGVPMTLLGILFHYIVAFSFTILFFWLYKQKTLGRSIIVNSILYGIFAWFIMNFIIVPLTKIGWHAPLSPTPAITQAAILIVAIGLPLSIIAKRFYSLK